MDDEHSDGMAKTAAAMEMQQLRGVDVRYEDADDDLATNSQPLRCSDAPLMWTLQWCLSWMIPGLGMFAEAYFIFSIGNIESLFKAVYPDCWKPPYSDCSYRLIHSMTYSQVGGIIAGMITISFFADRLGRKWGSVATAAIMFIGGLLLTASKAPTVNGMFLMYTISQAIFGYGVGGEYPVASTSASERAEASPELMRRRGRTVVLTFSMQGVGNFVNVLVLIILLAMCGQTGTQYIRSRVDVVWRMSFALGLIPILYMLWYRLFRLRESHVWHAKKLTSKRFDYQKLRTWFDCYWHREFGCAMGWFVWDFAFYGNKLFQGTFIGIIEPQAKGNVFKTLQWTLLNSAVALAGYYFAAFTIDYRWMGRRNMQVMGFMWMFVLFIICAAAYDTLTQPGAAIHGFQFLYYLSSFWGQFGPNATTWLLPSESFPTEMRALSHGIAAGTGKAGALVAGVVFPLVSDQGKFWISGFCGLAGAILTVLFIPDLTGLDLHHNDLYWQAACDGRQEEYEGEYVNPKYLSLYEQRCGLGKQYNAAGATAVVSSITAHGMQHSQSKENLLVAA